MVHLLVEGLIIQMGIGEWEGIGEDRYGLIMNQYVRYIVQYNIINTIVVLFYVPLYYQKIS